ncbi:MAG: UPF0182 family protein, partial [Acidimicrobiales bacterium]
MRVSSDLPERRRPSSSSRRRTIAAIVVGLVLLLAISLKGLAGFYTDYLWFDALGFRSVFSTLLLVKVGLGLVFTGVFFLMMFISLTVAERIAPRFRPGGPDEEFLERYHEIVGGRQRTVRFVVAGVLAIIAGAGVSSEWQSWILFRNRVDFGVEDPQFGVDAGFYVFQLPFLSFTVNWLFMALIIVLVITATAHYLSGGIRVQSPAPERVTPQVKAHLSVLLALLALVKAGDYWLQRYELNFSTRGVVDGATYTDVNAQLPAINLLLIISLFACGLFIVNIWRRGWTYPAVAVGLWAFVALLIGTGYPAFIQQFQVRPDESDREAPYIEHNIEATRYAMGLKEIAEQPFEANTTLDPETVESGGDSVKNLPLVDPDIVIDTFQQLQAALAIHQIVDLDVDRYDVDGELTQVVTASRELHTDGNPDGSWERNHLAFTHGFGTVVAQANRDDNGGDPVFLLENTTLDQDPRFEVEVDNKNSHIYYGERTQAYAVTGTTRDEITSEEDNEDVTFRYDGDGGVGLNSTFRRAAFALRFNDLEMLISDFITDESRVLYKRTVHDRVTSVAPFLEFDRDPYAALVDGGIKWIIDGYTTSNRFPYAQRADVSQLVSGSDLRRPLNYVRNSVKAVVDAYDGTVELYVMRDPVSGDDAGDPIIQAYQQEFPSLFRSFEDISPELAVHLRYPKDLFTLQTDTWSRYHLDEPAPFYDRTRAWDIAGAPSPDLIQSARQTATAAQAAATGTATNSTSAVAPYYVQLKLPGEEQLEYVLLRPFVRASQEGENKNLLSAFMVASSELDTYGDLNVYEMTSQGVEGPTIVDSNIRSDQTVALVLNRLSEGGSEVKAGNLFLVPMDEETMIWVRPVYVQARGGDDVVEVPQLRFVIVVSDAGVIMQRSFSAALYETLLQSGYTRAEALEVLVPIFGDVDTPIDILAVV